MENANRAILLHLETKKKSGGQKIGLEFDVDSLRICDLGEDENPILCFQLCLIQPTWQWIQLKKKTQRRRHCGQDQAEADSTALRQFSNWVMADIVF